MSNVKTVQDMYAAYGRGDVPAILESLDENISWDADSSVPEVPWLKPRRGKSEVPAFFESLAPIEFHRFEPHTFFESGNKVLALILIEATFSPGGQKRLIPNEGHLWDFNAAGKAVSLHHVTDTYQHLMGFRGD